MLFDGDSVHEVLDPISAAAPKGTLVIDITTSGPEAARRLGAEARRHGLRYVDAPVAGSLAPAEAGTLAIFVGGSDADVAAARPLLELMGAPDRIRHMGEVGGGNALKVVINMCLGIAMAGIGDALRLGAELDLDREVLLDALEAGPLSFPVKQKRDMLAKGEFTPPSFSLDLICKDLQVALDAAGAAASALTLAAATLALGREASGAGLGDDDYAVMAGYRAEIIRAAS
jgi:3-hydroxyisobutyrate dehydrogenase